MMGLTLIKNRFLSPERIARNPQKAKGGWVFTVPPKDWRRYSAAGRRELVAEWTKWGALSVASVIGGMPFGGGIGALTATSPFMEPGQLSNLAGGPAYNSTTLDATTDFYAYIFRVPPGGFTLESFEFAVSTTSGSPTLDLAFESLDSGGLVNATQTAYAANTFLNGYTPTVSHGS